MDASDFFLIDFCLQSWSCSQETFLENGSLSNPPFWSTSLVSVILVFCGLLLVRIGVVFVSFFPLLEWEATLSPSTVTAFVKGPVWRWSAS